MGEFLDGARVRWCWSAGGEGGAVLLAVRDGRGLGEDLNVVGPVDVAHWWSVGIRALQYSPAVDQAHWTIGNSAIARRSDDLESLARGGYWYHPSGSNRTAPSTTGRRDRLLQTPAGVTGGHR
jgi:hypothetical protein